MPALLIIRGVIGAILREARLEHLLECVDVATGRVPGRVQRFDLRSQKMVGATRSELGQAWSVVRVYEIQDVVAHLDRADLASLAAHFPPQPRQQISEHTLPLRFG